MITQEEWMDLLSYRSMAAAGASWAEIARLAGCDWRTARKYLSGERPWPPRYRPRPPRAKLIDPYAATIDAALRASEAQLRATTIYERLVADHGFPDSYQRVKEYVARRRPEIAASRRPRPGWPGWAPRSRPDGAARRRSGAAGGSWLGSAEELRELRFRHRSSSAMRSSCLARRSLSSAT